MNKQCKLLLIISQECPFCTQLLSDLLPHIKSGVLPRVEILNASTDPELYKKFEIEYVPYIKLDSIILQGELTVPDILTWKNKMGTDSFARDYIAYLIRENQLKPITSYIKQHPESLALLIDILAEDSLSFENRLGIGVVLEELQEEMSFEFILDQLVRLLNHDEANLRGDACHYLGMCKNLDVLEHLKSRLLIEEEEDVREVLEDVIADLRTPLLREN